MARTFLNMQYFYCSFWFTRTLHILTATYASLLSARTGLGNLAEIISRGCWEGVEGWQNEWEREQQQQQQRGTWMGGRLYCEYYRKLVPAWGVTGAYIFWCMTLM